jgi:hypothetical protein
VDPRRAVSAGSAGKPAEVPALRQRRVTVMFDIPNRPQVLKR